MENDLIYMTLMGRENVMISQNVGSLKLFPEAKN
jgi:hypothetical protein